MNLTLGPGVLWSLLLLGLRGWRGRRFPSDAAGILGSGSRFGSSPEAFRYQLQPVMATPRYTVSRLTFPSPVVTPDPENNVVHAEFFDPVGFKGRRPGVVVLHILGADFPLSRYIASRLADQGVAALFVKLPYYGERRPKGGPAPVPMRFLSADIERTMTSMRQGVCDVRRAVCWLGSRSNIDSARLGVAGISLGGIVSSIAAAVDPAVREWSVSACGRRPFSGSLGDARAGEVPSVLAGFGSNHRGSEIFDRSVRSLDPCEGAGGKASPDDCRNGR